jgi:putative protease
MIPEPVIPELLAPAGDWDALRAAAANGADAVYFGLSNFNARHRAANFTVAELPQIMDYLHARNVRGYVAFNTLIFSEELAAASDMIAAIAAAGADAVIVQDLGLARLIHRLAPTLPIHGSTQMTLTEARGIEAVAELGVERVILARELSIDDIRRITTETALPVEVFVHGALCVAYSGQCLTSEALGGRSANRGQCAQACRLPYELIVDSAPRDLGDQAYLLSPQDLASHDLIAELLAAGVCSFKIEGRLKSAQYVAVTTQTYRAALDAAWQNRAFELSKQGQIDLAQSFSRGFSHGFLSGVNHQTLVPARFPKSRGVRVGTVQAISARQIVVALDAMHDRSILKPGDGVVFDEGHPEQDEQGGRIVEVQADPANRAVLRVTLLPGSVNVHALTVGCIVWRTDDPALRKRLEQSFNRERPVKREPLSFTLAGTIGGPLSLSAADAAGRTAAVTWNGPLEAARKHPLDLASLRTQLDRLGDTPFALGSVALSTEAGAMVPKSVLNGLRREVVEAIVARRAAGGKHAVLRPQALVELRGEIAERPQPSAMDPDLNQREAESAESAEPRLSVLARSLDQLEAVLRWQPRAGLPRPEIVYCDFEELRRYREAVPLARAAGLPIGLATLRIVKPGEEGLTSLVAQAEPDAVLVRNLASLNYFRARALDTCLIGDFSLNVANELTADWFLRQGLTRLTPSYDLNWEQFQALCRHSEPIRLEAVVHQHMPMFHMEHCVFAATLSSGTDWRDCGRPCDHHRVELRDRSGAQFPLLADTGCRNTVFNSVAQSAAEYIGRMRALGVAHFRVELLRELPNEVAPLLDRYARVLTGLESGRTTWNQLQVLNQLGVTRGTLQLG